MIERMLARIADDRPISSDSAAALAEAMSPPRLHRKGREIIRQFSNPQESTLLVRGWAGRVVTLQSGVSQITALHVPGDFVDLHSYLLPRMDHSVVAITDCEVSAIRHAELADLVRTYPDLQRGLWFLTIVDAAIHRQWLTVVGRRNAEEGLAHLLCELYVRLGEVGLAADQAFACPLTQAEMADILCLSVVHLNRTLQALRSYRLVTWRGDKVEILDWPRLCELAQFDAAYLNLRDRARRC